MLQPSPGGGETKNVGFFRCPAEGDHTDKKNHVVPPSSKDETLAHYSVSREVPPDEKTTSSLVVEGSPRQAVAAQLGISPV